MIQIQLTDEFIEWLMGEIYVGDKGATEEWAQLFVSKLYHLGGIESSHIARLEAEIRELQAFRSRVVDMLDEAGVLDEMVVRYGRLEDGSLGVISADSVSTLERLEAVFRALRVAKEEVWLIR